MKTHIVKKAIGIAYKLGVVFANTLTTTAVQRSM